ncbi:hypothetical protein ACH4YO_30765 [Streptomyces noursei]|uniref:hypothetical protein n=1 Tax=Streptomyces noursei TaxID=1971 RepID=UPI0033D4C3F2
MPLRQQLAGAYDLVGFDPRGVGGSARAGCGLASGDRELVTLRSWPAADGGIAELDRRRSRRTSRPARSGRTGRPTRRSGSPTGDRPTS